MKNLWPLAVIFAGIVAAWLGSCVPVGQETVLDKDLGALLARCGGELMFGGVSITGHITCPVPKQVLAP